MVEVTVEPHHGNRHTSEKEAVCLEKPLFL